MEPTTTHCVFPFKLKKQTDTHLWRKKNFINDKLQNKLTFLYLHLLRLCSIFYWDWKCIDIILVQLFPGSENAFGSAKNKIYFFCTAQIYLLVTLSIVYRFNTSEAIKCFKYFITNIFTRNGKGKQKHLFHFSSCFARENFAAKSCCLTLSVANFLSTNKHRSSLALNFFRRWLVECKVKEELLLCLWSKLRISID